MLVGEWCRRDFSLTGSSSDWTTLTPPTSFMDKLQVFFPNSWVFFLPKLFPFWIFLQFSSQFHNLYHQTLIFTWKRVNVSPVIYHRKTRSLSWSRTRGLTRTDPLFRVRTNLANIIHHSLLSSDKIFPCYWRMARPAEPCLQLQDCLAGLALRVSCRTAGARYGASSLTIFGENS